jgi:hypothetical protein
MRDQEQNLNDEETGGKPDFSMPDCCGPMMDRMKSAEGEGQASKGWSVCEGMMKDMTDGESPMESCPMSAMFKKTFGKRGSSLLTFLPGLLLVLVGVAIILEPQILVWLMAAVAIFAGLMLAAAATFFRKVAAGLQS